MAALAGPLWGPARGLWGFFWGFIASLIGAGGLGKNVLEALQYAAKGQGMLAGLAILFCAMVIDRVIQGHYNRSAAGKA